MADTHTVLWYLFASPRLSERARQIIDKAAMDGLNIRISAITLAEVVYLVEKNRISSNSLERLQQVCQDPDRVFAEIPLDGNIVQMMTQIPRDMVPYLPDRIIASTALSLNVPIITRDSKIRAAQLESLW